MDTLFGIILAMVGLALWAGIIFVSGWKWWLQPMIWAYQLRQWVWLAVITIGWPLGGIVYLYRFVDDYVVPVPSYYTKGEVIVWHGNAYRVIGHHRDAVRCLYLGPSQVRAVPSGP